MSKSLGFVVVGYNPGATAGSLDNPGLILRGGQVFPLNGDAIEAARRERAHDAIDEMNTRYVVAELVPLEGE